MPIRVRRMIGVAWLLFGVIVAVNLCTILRYGVPEIRKSDDLERAGLALYVIAPSAVLVLAASGGPRVERELLGGRRGRDGPHATHPYLGRCLPGKIVRPLHGRRSAS